MSWSTSDSESDEIIEPTKVKANEVFESDAGESQGKKNVEESKSENTVQPLEKKIKNEIGTVALDVGKISENKGGKSSEISSSKDDGYNNKKKGFKISFGEDDETALTHGETAFLGSVKDPLHPNNLNVDALVSSKFLNQALKKTRKEGAEESDEVVPSQNKEMLGDKNKAKIQAKKHEIVKGCPPEVQQQYRELLDAGLISRKDYLLAIEKYIANLPEALRPDPDSDSASNGDGDSSSEVSLGLDDKISSEEDDEFLFDEEEDTESENGNERIVPVGFKHTPLTFGDATNYPIKGDACQIHFEGRLPPPEDVDEDEAEPVVFDSTYERKEPMHIQLGRGDVIQGIEYALAFMSCGQKSTLIIPPEWAYGAIGFPPLVKSNQTLHYDVELIRFSNDADARSVSGRPANPLPIGMEQFTHGKFDMDDVTMNAESSYWQAINESLTKK